MRRRLVLAIAGVAAAAVVLLAVPLGIVLARNYRDEELLRLQRDAIAATRQIDLSQHGDPLELPRSPDELAVYDRSGRRVAGRGPALAPPLVRALLRTGRPAAEARDGRLIVAVGVLSGERLTGAMLAQRSDGGAVRDARAAWLVLGAVSVAVILAAALAAVLLGRRLAAPLEGLAGAARRLGEGDFSVRAGPAGVREVAAVGRALDVTAQRLDDLVTRERAFSADASHQLRTPLQALRIELEALELRGDAPPEVAAALAEVDRLQGMIETLLAVARDAPRTTAVTDLTVVLDEVEARWRGPLAERGRPLRITLGPSPPRVRASPRVVGEILEVLVANACRHGRGEVTVGVREVDAYVSVHVADEGAGFGEDPEAAFARRHSGGDGHGIGLALARSLAHAEGGRLVLTRGGPRPVLTLLLPAAGDRSSSSHPAAPGSGQ